MWNYKVNDKLISYYPYQPLIKYIHLACAFQLLLTKSLIFSISKIFLNSTWILIRSIDLFEFDWHRIHKYANRYNSVSGVSNRILHFEAIFKMNSHNYRCERQEITSTKSSEINRVPIHLKLTYWLNEGMQMSTILSQVLLFLRVGSCQFHLIFFLNDRK